RADDARFDGDLDKANTKDVKATGIEGDVTADLAAERLPKATQMVLSPMASPAEFMAQLPSKKADILFVDKGGVNSFSKNNPGQIRLVKNVPPARVYGEHLA